MSAPSASPLQVIAWPVARGEPRDPSLVWSPAGSDEWSFAGSGACASVVGASLAAVRDEVARTLRDVSVARHPDAGDLPSARLFGGATFLPGHPSDDPAWSAFPPVAFTLPRWLLARRGGRSVLMLALRESERAEAGRWLRELDAVMRPAEPGTGVRPTHGDVVYDLPLDTWSALVDDALSLIRGGGVDKVVASRRSHVRAADPWSRAALVERLLATRNAGVVRFLFEHGGALFLGATPERLLAKRGAEVTADALAGSIPRAASTDEDALRAQRLLRSDKDRREHALVVDGILRALRASCAFDAAPETRVRTLQHIHHLWTPLVGRLREPGGAHVLALVEALHPTPALGGTPRDAALAWISAREPAPRGWYAAPVGWCDADGDGEFVVAIRSAVVRGRDAWVYAGAGLVDGSDAREEYRETRAKMAPMLHVLGVETPP